MRRTFVLARAIAIAEKEVKHILRDPFTLGMMIGIPLIMVLFFGFAIDFDFGNIRLSVFDFNRTPQSRAIARAFSSSKYFIIQPPGNASSPILDVQSGRAAVAMVINSDFSKKIASSGEANVQLLVDGTDNTKTGVITGYFGGIQRSANNLLTGTTIQEPIAVTTRFLYNPELSTRWFVVPGLIVVVTGLLSILMTALTVAREWENGSMELLLSTPVQPLEVIAGKIAPYAVLGIGTVLFVYIMATIIFRVPFQGNFLLFIIASVLFISASLAQGLLVSIITRQQQKAMQMSMMLGMLPALLFSGFIFPIESMPVFFQYFTMIFPARWFMMIIRGIMLMGAGLYTLAIPFAALLIICALLVNAARARFKRNIEP